MQGIIDHTNEVINAVRKQTGSVILFYSCGKDSIAMLDIAAKKFDRVVCVFMYFVKGLEHIEKYIAWSKARYHNVEFIQLPHWNLTWILREGFYCQPNPKIKTKTLSDTTTEAKQLTGIDFVLLGMKQSDSLNRRLTLKNYELEAISKSGLVYPLSKWSNKEVSQYLNINFLPTPIKYSNKKKSQGLGFDVEVFLFLREHYPNDLRMIYNQFPLSEQILFEYDFKQQQNGSKN